MSRSTATAAHQSHRVRHRNRIPLHIGEVIGVDRYQLPRSQTLQIQTWKVGSAVKEGAQIERGQELTSPFQFVRSLESPLLNPVAHAQDLPSGHLPRLTQRETQWTKRSVAGDLESGIPFTAH